MNSSKIVVFPSIHADVHSHITLSINCQLKSSFFFNLYQISRSVVVSTLGVTLEFFATFKKQKQNSPRYEIANNSPNKYVAHYLSMAIWFFGGPALCHRTGTTSRYISRQMNYLFFLLSIWWILYDFFFICKFWNLSCSFLIFARQGMPGSSAFATAAYTNRRKNSCELLVFDCGLTPFCDLVFGQ